MSQRLRKVNESVKEIIAELLGGLKDPRIGFVTITDVRTTSDLRQSQVFWTVLPDDDETREQTAAGLHSATPLIRRELGQRMRTRLTPELDFHYDPVPERGRRIEQILRDVPPAPAPDGAPDGAPGGAGAAEQDEDGDA